MDNEHGIMDEILGYNSGYEFKVKTHERRQFIIIMCFEKQGQSEP